MIVLTAIDFDDQPRLVAYKICDVAAEGHLAAEFVSADLVRAQDLPGPTFCFGHVPPQLTGPRVRPSDGGFFHVVTSTANGITPSQSSPIKGEGFEAAPCSMRGRQR